MLIFYREIFRYKSLGGKEWREYFGAGAGHMVLRGNKEG